MNASPQPFVSVVTPFYNTEDYLQECIESVLSQTYRNWEYVLLDNCSQDRSAEIAEKYAKKDMRIRLIRNPVFLNQVQNYNQALKQISGTSQYCKMVQADDWLFPNCVEGMVAVAEKNKSIGMVGSYRLVGSTIAGDGLPYPSEFMTGKDICRFYLKRGFNHFGTPTSMLFRSDLVRRRIPFFDENSILEDVEVCFDLLQDFDYGFVHQVLTYTRTQEGALLWNIRFYDYFWLHWFILLKKYGPLYLSPEEFKVYSRLVERVYLSLLGRAFLLRRGKDFWAYHKAGLREINYNHKKKLPGFTLKALLSWLFNPKNTVDKLIEIRHRRHGLDIQKEGETRINWAIKQTN